MRFIFVATVAVAAAALVNSAISFDAGAQKRRTQQQTYNEDRTQNPQSFDACVAMAKQRGYTASDHEYRTAARAFVLGCMQGRQR
jgi:hypothetical protein